MGTWVKCGFRYCSSCTARGRAVLSASTGVTNTARPHPSPNAAMVLREVSDSVSLPPAATLSTSGCSCARGSSHSTGWLVGSTLPARAGALGSQAAGVPVRMGAPKRGSSTARTAASRPSAQSQPTRGATSARK